MKPQEFIDKWLGWANNKEEINDEILADLDAMNKALSQHDVSWRSEQFVCLCPRNEKDNCDRKEPCKECETYPHLRQTNCH